MAHTDDFIWETCYGGGPNVDETYQHYRTGDKYKIKYRSVDENTLEALVTYRSTKGVNWTRTVKQFTEIVKFEKDGILQSSPRFIKINQNEETV